MINERAHTEDLFIKLVFGIQSYLQASSPIVPSGLRRALNELSFASREAFPKTLAKFIELCHTPVSEWYPYVVPTVFLASQPILYDGSLSEEADDYILAMSEELDLSSNQWGEIPQTVLDNYRMVELLKRLRDASKPREAQQLYVSVRSYLIEHSWITLSDFRDQTSDIRDELAAFYEEAIGLPNQLRICERCGLLQWKNQRWESVKPSYCADHGVGSPLVREIPLPRQLYRLKRGIHLRTFLPGQLELTLFAFAEEMQANNPDHLVQVERYPGLDTYDLRLTFSDGEMWGIDAKDHSDPERLAMAVRLPYGEGELSYGSFYYVLPNERTEERDYWERLQAAVGSRPSNLFVASLSHFKQLVTDKLIALSNQSKTKKGKRE